MNIIRQMIEEDLEAVYEIELENEFDTWPFSAFKIAFSMEESFVVIHPETFCIIGFLFGYQTEDEFSISNVAISKKYHNLGFGSCLLDYVMQKKTRENVSKFFLEVRMSNISAIHLYKKFGFRKLYIRKGYYQKPEEDAIVMGCLKEEAL